MVSPEDTANHPNPTMPDGELMDEIYVLMKHELGEKSVPIHAFTETSDVSEWMAANKPAYRYLEESDMWDDDPNSNSWVTLVKVPISGIAQPL